MNADSFVGDQRALRISCKRSRPKATRSVIHNSAARLTLDARHENPNQGVHGMKIKDFTFGSIRIDGATYDYDIIIDPRDTNAILHVTC
jgi:hypothetical protein